jgi:hypothetical protein
VTSPATSETTRTRTPDPLGRGPLVVGWWVAFIVPVYLAAAVAAYLGGGGVIVSIVIGLIAFAIGLGGARREDAALYYLIACIILAYTASSLITERASILSFRDLALVVSNVGIVLVMRRHRVHWQPVYALFLAVFAYFFYHAILTTDPNFVLGTSSRNGISWLMIASAATLYVVMVKEGRPISVLPALLTLVTSVWAIGRSGIVSSAVMVTGLLLITWRRSRSTVYLIGMASIVATLAFPTVLDRIVETVGTYFQYFGAKGLTADRRIEIFNHYTTGLNLRGLLFGVDWLSDDVMHRFNYNLHNSYLSFHARIGAASLVFVGMAMMALIRHAVTTPLYSVLLFAVMLRAFTDTDLFFTSFDFLPYYLVTAAFTSSLAPPPSESSFPQPVLDVPRPHHT